MRSLLLKGFFLIRREWPTLSRFVVVGGTTVLLKVLTYAFISRVVWPEGPRVPENTAALLFAQAYNYLMNRYWTFGHQKPAAGALKRYLTVFAVGMTADAALFSVGHHVLGLYDIVVSFGSSLIISMFTFVTHRVFTFHADPYRKRADVVQSA